jgi:predicted permease
MLKTELLVTQVTVVLAAMPAALTPAMLASQYGKDEGFAVSMVFLSTVASMVTVPLLCMLMMAI